MKILMLWDNYGAGSPDPALPVSWLTDSCLLRDRKPLYVPDFDTDFRLFPTLAVRIDRLGKGIQAKFAHRYWQEAAVYISVRACARIETLTRAGMPLDSAVAYDNSLVASPFFPLTPEQVPGTTFCLLRNGIKELEWSGANLKMDTAEAIQALSHCNTLKTGDLILLGIPREGVPIAPGDKIQIFLKRPTDTEPQLYTEFQVK